MHGRILYACMALESIMMLGPVPSTAVHSASPMLVNLSNLMYTAETAESQV